MKRFFQRLLKFALYTAAGILIALAIAVGLFRLFLPRLPEYQAEIKNWASDAIGMRVEFSGMNARWSLSGPELAFYDAELNTIETGSSLIAAQEVRVGVALTRLLAEGALVVDSVVVRETSVAVRQAEDGRWQLQEQFIDELLGDRSGQVSRPPAIQVIGEDISIVLQRPAGQSPLNFTMPRTVVSVDSKRIAVDGTLRLPSELGRQLHLSATQVVAPPGQEDRHWDVRIEADNVDLAGWSTLLTDEGRQFRSGFGDVDLAIEYADTGVRNASANVALAGVALGDGEAFDIDGRFDVNFAADGWLVAAEQLKLQTAGNAWRESSLRVESSTDDSGKIVMVDMRASYLNIGDAALFGAWLPAEQRQRLTDLDPSGIVTELVATVSDVDTEQPRFDVAAEFADVGFAASGKRPGVRGFSGLLRANRLGGRLEMRSRNTRVEAPEYLVEPINFDYADGTVIWRSTDERTTVLSDSIRVGNDVFDSQFNVQLNLQKDGESPVIDLASDWSVRDVSSLTAYIPQKVIKPKLYNWFQSALVAGSIPRGKTILRGPLDKFPFDNDEGQFLIEAAVRNLEFKYAQRWPAAEQADMEIVLDRTRLYSENNRSVSAGNESVDAQFEIADLRDPILRIEALSTGTLETIRAFSVQSPINDVFGGKLDNIAVSGDASFTLDLTVPLRDTKAFEFTSVIRSNNGTLAIDGFKPPLTDLIGEVTISREAISSQALGATFLGHPISIALARSDEERFSVVASSAGYVTAEAVVNDLGVPLQGLISGGADYTTRILFPKGGLEEPSPLTIRIDSDLTGMAFNLPAPAGKLQDEALQIQGDIRFMPGGARIESAGFAENQTAWQLAFIRDPEKGALDFDRGVVTLGRDVMQPAETRGLHIRGTTDTLRFEDWLNLSRSGKTETGTADRIRSIDLTIANLHAIGQHLEGHKVRVDRSARDWLVQIEGEDISGSVFVPYNFDSDRAMVLEMEKLRLPGDESAPEDEPSTPDPRKLPPITVTAAEFVLGDRNLGSLQAQIDRLAEGLQATSIVTKDETFEVSASGSWVIDESEPLGSRTSATGTLNSRDVRQTMARLGFDPGISSDALQAEFDVSWSGSPRADFLDVLDGNVQVRFGAGQLEEVEPGAGRVFGLMSIVALPRRLSLDFSDVFDKGFGFDKIAGTFRIDDGETYTCDLSLEGPAADIGIVGRAGLASRDYDQAAVVSANFGNTLPIVGAVVAGPQAAAALLIFSQIFKKPLQEVSQVYYAIKGTWDEPLVDSTSSDDFANRGVLAGCVEPGAEAPSETTQEDMQ
ncbi:MAG: TIGR02099 family protein [Gammaproteobacteria bacterium]|nr:TIGR02099 family protein [Gammaproteobacteria bacterium]